MTEKMAAEGFRATRPRPRPGGAGKVRGGPPSRGGWLCGSGPTKNEAAPGLGSASLAAPQWAGRVPVFLREAALSAGQSPVAMRLPPSACLSPGPPGSIEVGPGVTAPPEPALHTRGRAAHRPSHAGSPHSGPFPSPEPWACGALCAACPLGAWGSAGPVPGPSEQASELGKLVLGPQGTVLGQGRWTFLPEPVANRTWPSRLGAPSASPQGPSEARNPEREQSRAAGRRGSG